MTIRIISQIFSNSELSEEFLLDLYITVSKIILIFIRDCKKSVNQFISSIDGHLEFFKNDELNEANYYYTAIKSIDEKEMKIDSEQFISVQQQFYDFYFSSCQSFKQLASNCQKEELKKDLEEKYDNLLKLRTRYSHWIHHFYLIIY